MRLVASSRVRTVSGSVILVVSVRRSPTFGERGPIPASCASLPGADTINPVPRRPKIRIAWSAASGKLSYGRSRR